MDNYLSRIKSWWLGSDDHAKAMSLAIGIPSSLIILFLVLGIKALLVLALIIAVITVYAIARMFMEDMK